MLNLGCGRRTHSSWINIDYSRIAILKTSWFMRRFASSRVPPNYVNHNLRNGIPYANETVDVVYSSHFLEHLPHQEALPFVREVYRVLKIGGIIRLVVPDLESITRNYLETLQAVRAGQPEADVRYEWATIWLLDQMVRTRSGGEMAQWLYRYRESAMVRSMQGICTEIATASPPSHDFRARLLHTVLRNSPASSGELHRWMYDEVSLRRLLEDARFKEIRRVSHGESRTPNWSDYGLDSNPDGTPHQPHSLWMEAVR